MSDKTEMTEFKYKDHVYKVPKSLLLKHENEHMVPFLVELDALFKKYSIDSTFMDRQKKKGTEFLFVFESNGKRLELSPWPKFHEQKPGGTLADVIPADYEYWNRNEGFIVSKTAMVPSRIVLPIFETETTETEDPEDFWHETNDEVNYDDGLQTGI